MSSRSLKIDIGSDGDIDVQLAGILRSFLARVGSTARTRSQQIIAAETTDRSGELRTKVNFDVIVRGGAVLLEFYNDAGKYAAFHEYGTGMYGPKGKMIKPKSGYWTIKKGPRKGQKIPRMLTWIDPDRTDPRTGEPLRIFAKEVRGVPAKKFMSKGIEFALDQEIGRMNA